MSILQQIRDWYEAGWNAGRVEGALSEGGLPVTVAVDGHDMAITATEALQTLQQSMATAMTAMATEIADLRQDVAASRQETDQLRRVIDDRLNARDGGHSCNTATGSRTRASPKRSWWPWKR